MRVSLMTTESEARPGTGFALSEKEEKSVFTKEPGAACGVDTFKGEGSES
jgi:hypothetical protein